MENELSMFQAASKPFVLKFSFALCAAILVGGLVQHSTRTT